MQQSSLYIASAQNSCETDYSILGWVYSSCATERVRPMWSWAAHCVSITCSVGQCTLQSQLIPCSHIELMVSLCSMAHYLHKLIRVASETLRVCTLVDGFSLVGTEEMASLSETRILRSVQFTKHRISSNWVEPGACVDLTWYIYLPASKNNWIREVWLGMCYLISGQSPSDV